MRNQKLVALLGGVLAAGMAALPATAAEMALEVKPPTELPPEGASFTVSVELSNNPGFSSLQLTLDYDSTVYTCTDIEAGELMKGAMYAFNAETEGEAKLSAASVGNMKGDGALASFTFVAQPGAGVPEFTILDLDVADEKGGELPVQVVGAEYVQPLATEIQDPPGASPPSLPPEDEVKEGGISEQDAPFTDTAVHWGVGSIAKAVELGLFRGYPDGSFRPDAPITRAQYMAVLYRASGSPAVQGDTPFEDLEGQSEEFKKAIAWGVENGCINGRTPTVFDPDGLLTRQEAVKVLFGLSEREIGLLPMFTTIYDAEFPDSEQIAEWAKRPMYWAIYTGIISGSDVGLEPLGCATRAQMCKILVNYLEMEGRNEKN